MLRQAFTDRLKQAMKARDARTVSTVRLILAGLKERDVAARAEGNVDGLAEPEIARMLQSDDQAAPRIDRALRARQARRSGAAGARRDRASSRAFLPQQMSEDEIAAAAQAAIAETGAAGIKDMGKVMAALRERHAGSMDFSRAGPIVKRLVGLRRVRGGDGAHGAARRGGFFAVAFGGSGLKSAEPWRFRRAFSTNCAAGFRCRAWSAAGSSSPGAGASMPGSARFITKKRRPSTSSRTKIFSTASDAARMATRSVLSCAPTTSISSKRSKNWPAKPGSRSRRPRRRSAKRRSGRRRCSKLSKPPPPFTRPVCGRRPAAAPRDYLQARGLDPETIRRFRLGWASGGPAGAAPRSRRRFSRAAAGRSRAAASTRRGRAVRLFPRPGHVSDRRPRRPGHRLWRPGDRRRPAQIPEFARQPGLRERARALRLVGGASGRRGSRATRSSPKAIWT